MSPSVFPYMQLPSQALGPLVAENPEWTLLP
jgi:hypothetical protein